MDVYMREIKVPYKRPASSASNFEREYSKRTLTPTFRGDTPAPGEKQKPYSVQSVQYIQGSPWSARCSSAHYVQRYPWSGNLSPPYSELHKKPFGLTDVKRLMLSEIRFYHGKDSRFKFPAIRGIQSLTHKPRIGSAWNCENEAFRQMYQSSTFQPRYRILTKDKIIQSSGTVPVK